MSRFINNNINVGNATYIMKREEEIFFFIWREYLRNHESKLHRFPPKGRHHRTATTTTPSTVLSSLKLTKLGT